MPEQGIFIMAQQKTPSAGIFTLPSDFDKVLYSAQWITKGPAVDAAKMPQPIVGTNYGAEGWAVWQYPKGHKLAGRPAEVATRSGVYILMFRPLSVQEGVNALYGNVSKKHLLREQSGETIAGQAVIDPGILSDSRIRAATGITEFGGDDPQMRMNPEPTGTRVQAQPLATAEA
jgi:hypothetical protein